jgi:hypothetical protein
MATARVQDGFKQGRARPQTGGAATDIWSLSEACQALQVLTLI